MTREPNTRLHDLFGLAGWSKGELARLVNRQAAAMGHPQLATDTSRVRRWIDMGETPRDPVPRVLAALFTERLGRVVTIEDLGSGPARAHGEAAGRRGARTTPTDCRGRPNGRQRSSPNSREWTSCSTDAAWWARVPRSPQDPHSAAPCTTGCTPIRPLRPTPPASTIPCTPTPLGTTATRPPPSGPQEIDALERSVEVFRAWDAARGGGLQRKAVVGQLNEVGGMLAYHHPDHLQRRLWGVAANLAVLAGWMSHDVGLEPTAQKYFVIAAHAAREGGDRPRAGEALSRAARQMVHLGRPDDALDLMKLAKSGSGEQVLPRTRAMLHTIEAWAQASMGRGQAMRRTLGRGGGPLRLRQGRRAAAELDADVRRGGPARHAGPCLPHAGRPRPGRGRPRPAPRREGPGAADDGRQRSKIFDYLSMASACFIADDPEQADRYARLALVSMGQTSSHRTWDRLREMYRLTGQYAGYPKIQDAARGDPARPAEGRWPGGRAGRPQV